MFFKIYPFQQIEWDLKSLKNVNVSGILILVNMHGVKWELPKIQERFAQKKIRISFHTLRAPGTKTDCALPGRNASGYKGFPTSKRGAYSAQKTAAYEEKRCNTRNFNEFRSDFT